MATTQHFNFLFNFSLGLRSETLTPSLLFITWIQFYGINKYCIHCKLSQIPLIKLFINIIYILMFYNSNYFASVTIMIFTSIKLKISSLYIKKNLFIKCLWFCIVLMLVHFVVLGIESRVMHVVGRYSAMSFISASFCEPSQSWAVI